MHVDPSWCPRRATSGQMELWKELSDGDRIRFEFEVQNSVSVTQFLPDPCSGIVPVMPSRKTMIAAILICLVAAGLFAQQSALSPGSLRQWLTYISSYDLEGRSTFSEGLGLAAAYIADQLKDAGVNPGGDHGTYFQRVPVLGVRT